MSELCDQPAVDLRRMIGTKAVSPVDLLESCIKRIEAVDPENVATPITGNQHESSGYLGRILSKIDTP